MAGGRFPTPWEQDPAWTDLAGLAGSMVQARRATLAERAFTDVLREAAAYRDLRHPPGEDPRVCLAQLVVGVAAALERPEPQQWAIRWLDWLGHPYLRQWWRHAAADRRIAGTVRLTAPLTAIAGDGPDLVTGDQLGQVHRRDMSDGIAAAPVLLAALHAAVWSIAVRNGTVVAGGAGSDLLILRPDGRQPVTLPRSGITAVATDGERAACGSETGQVWLFDRAGPPGGTEIRWPDGDADHPAVLALTFTVDGAVLCVRADGEIAEHRGGQRWRPSHSCGQRVRVAQWHTPAEHPRTERSGIEPTGGEMVALGLVNGTVAVLRRSAGAWQARKLAIRHLSLAAVGWSPDGRLASAGYDRRIWICDGAADGAPRYWSLPAPSPASVLAFSSQWLVTGHERRLVAWRPSTGRSGRALSPPDPVTALGLDPSRPEVMASGTSWGWLRQHDAAGRIRHDPVAVCGRVYRLAAAPDGWYVAASGGLYHWRPGVSLDMVAAEASRVVAGGAGGSWVAGCGNRVLVNGNRQFEHTNTVVDALVAGDGSVITLDDSGELRIDGVAVSAQPPGRRLLAAESARSVLLLSATDGTVYRYASRRTIRRWSAGPGFSAAIAMTPEIVAIAYSDGHVAIVDAAKGTRLASVHLPAAVLAGDGSRLAAAAGDEVSLFSLVKPGPSYPGQELHVRLDRAASTGSGYLATMPDGSRWPMAADLRLQLAKLVADTQPGYAPDGPGDTRWDRPAGRGGQRDGPNRDLPLHTAERLKGWLDAAGLRLAADRLAGRQIPLPARLRLVISHPDLHVLPWELAVDQRLFRVVRTAEPSGPLAVPSAAGREAPWAAGQIRLLTLRAPDAEFETFSRIYSSVLNRFPRWLAFQADEVPPVAGEPDLAELVAAPSDVIVLLAHAGPSHLRLAPGQTIGTERAAELLASAAPQLVVLAACQSVNLAWSLARRGVPAVIGLRTRASVWALTQLLEELLVNLMSGEALEDAFATALDACIRLPVTSAPVLYLHPDAPRPFQLVQPDPGS